MGIEIIRDVGMNGKGEGKAKCYGSGQFCVVPQQIIVEEGRPELIKI